MITYGYTPLKFDYDKEYCRIIRKRLSKRAYYRWRGKRKAFMRQPVYKLYAHYVRQMETRMKASLTERLYGDDTGGSGLDLLQ